jgi:hypothetical protein
MCDFLHISRPLLVRRALVAVLLTAVFIRALIPAGYMVQAPRDDGGPAGLVICSAHGPQRVDLPDAPVRSPDQAPESKIDATCAFAGAPGTAAPPVATAIPVLAFASVAVPHPERDVFVPPVRPASERGSRGPPAAA